MEPSHKPLPASVLVVDDDKAATDIISVMIAKKFPHVTLYIAYDGKMGLEVFKEHMPDLVITDVNMPNMDGIEMAEGIRSTKADTKFIVLTAYSDKRYLEKFSKIGFSEYLLKPIEFTKLFAAIEKSMVEVTVG